jgi:hypothetical protein
MVCKSNIGTPAQVGSQSELMGACPEVPAKIHAPVFHINLGGGQLLVLHRQILYSFLIQNCPCTMQLLGKARRGMKCVSISNFQSYCFSLAPKPVFSFFTFFFLHAWEIPNALWMDIPFNTHYMLLVNTIFTLMKLSVTATKGRNINLVCAL